MFCCVDEVVYHAEVGPVATIPSKLLSRNDLLCMAEDSVTQEIWFGTTVGAYVLSKKDYTVRHLHPLTENVRVFDMVQSRDGSMWVAAGLSVFRFTARGELVRQYKLEWQGKTVHASSLFLDSNGRLWVMQWDGGLLILWQIIHRQHEKSEARMQERLTEMKLRFLTNVSHELRTPLSPIDRRFMEKMQQVLSRHLTDASFTVDQFAEELAMSRISFYRKMNALTGMTPNKYLNEQRLVLADRLLHEGELNISEVAHKGNYMKPEILKTLRDAFK